MSVKNGSTGGAVNDLRIEPGSGDVFTPQKVAPTEKAGMLQPDIVPIDDAGSQKPHHVDAYIYIKENNDRVRSTILRSTIEALIDSLETDDRIVANTFISAPPPVIANYSSSENYDMLSARATLGAIPQISVNAIIAEINDAISSGATIVSRIINGALVITETLDTVSSATIISYTPIIASVISNNDNDTIVSSASVVTPLVRITAVSTTTDSDTIVSSASLVTQPVRITAAVSNTTDSDTMSATAYFVDSTVAIVTPGPSWTGALTTVSATPSMTGYGAGSGFSNITAAQTENPGAYGSGLDQYKINAASSWGDYCWHVEDDSFVGTIWGSVGADQVAGRLAYVDFYLENDTPVRLSQMTWNSNIGAFGININLRAPSDRNGVAQWYARCVPVNGKERVLSGTIWFNSRPGKTGYIDRTVRAVYVDATNGVNEYSDAARGTISKPFRTVEFALTCMSPSATESASARTGTKEGGFVYLVGNTHLLDGSNMMEASPFTMRDTPLNVILPVEIRPAPTNTGSTVLTRSIRQCLSGSVTGNAGYATRFVATSALNGNGDAEMTVTDMLFGKIVPYTRLVGGAIGSGYCVLSQTRSDEPDGSLGGRGVYLINWKTPLPQSCYNGLSTMQLKHPQLVFNRVNFDASKFVDFTSSSIYKTLYMMNGEFVDRSDTINGNYDGTGNVRLYRSQPAGQSLVSMTQNGTREPIAYNMKVKCPNFTGFNKYINVTGEFSWDALYDARTVGSRADLTVMNLKLSKPVTWKSRMHEADYLTVKKATYDGSSKTVIEFEVGPNYNNIGDSISMDGGIYFCSGVYWNNGGDSWASANTMSNSASGFVYNTDSTSTTITVTTGPTTGKLQRGMNITQTTHFPSETHILSQTATTESDGSWGGAGTYVLSKYPLVTVTGGTATSCVGALHKFTVLGDWGNAAPGDKVKIYTVGHGDALQTGGANDTTQIKIVRENWVLQNYLVWGFDLQVIFTQVGSSTGVGTCSSVGTKLYLTSANTLFAGQSVRVSSNSWAFVADKGNAGTSATEFDLNAPFIGGDVAAGTSFTIGKSINGASIANSIFNKLPLPSNENYGYVQGGYNDNQGQVQQAIRNFGYGCSTILSRTKNARACFNFRNGQNGFGVDGFSLQGSMIDAIASEAIFPPTSVLDVVNYRAPSSTNPIPSLSTRSSNIDSNIDFPTHRPLAPYTGQTITADIAAAFPFDAYGNPRRVGDPVGAIARTADIVGSVNSSNDSDTVNATGSFYTAPSFTTITPSASWTGVQSTGFTTASPSLALYGAGSGVAPKTENPKAYGSGLDVYKINAGATWGDYCWYIDNDNFVGTIWGSVGADQVAGRLAYVDFYLEDESPVRLTNIAWNSTVGAFGVNVNLRAPSNKNGVAQWYARCVPVNGLERILSGTVWFNSRPGQSGYIDRDARAVYVDPVNGIDEYADAARGSPTKPYRTLEYALTTMNASAISANVSLKTATKEGGYIYLVGNSHLVDGTTFNETYPFAERNNTPVGTVLPVEIKPHPTNVGRTVLTRTIRMLSSGNNTANLNISAKFIGSIAVGNATEPRNILTVTKVYYGRLHRGSKLYSTPLLNTNVYEQITSTEPDNSMGKRGTYAVSYKGDFGPALISAQGATYMKHSRMVFNNIDWDASKITNIATSSSFVTLYLMNGGFIDPNDTLNGATNPDGFVKYYRNGGSNANTTVFLSAWNRAAEAFNMKVRSWVFTGFNKYVNVSGEFAWDAIIDGRDANSRPDLAIFNLKYTKPTLARSSVSDFDFTTESVSYDGTFSTINFKVGPNYSNFCDGTVQDLGAIAMTGALKGTMDTWHGTNTNVTVASGYAYNAVEGSDLITVTSAPTAGRLQFGMYIGNPSVFSTGTSIVSQNTSNESDSALGKTGTYTLTNTPSVIGTGLRGMSPNGVFIYNSTSGSKVITVTSAPSSGILSVGDTLTSPVLTTLDTHILNQISSAEANGDYGKTGVYQLTRPIPVGMAGNNIVGTTANGCISSAKIKGDWRGLVNGDIVRLFLTQHGDALQMTISSNISEKSIRENWVIQNYGVTGTEIQLILVQCGGFGKTSTIGKTTGTCSTNGTTLNFSSPQILYTGMVVKVSPTSWGFIAPGAGADTGVGAQSFNLYSPLLDGDVNGSDFSIGKTLNGMSVVNAHMQKLKITDTTNFGYNVGDFNDSAGQVQHGLRNAGYLCSNLLGRQQNGPGCYVFRNTFDGFGVDGFKVQGTLIDSIAADFSYVTPQAVSLDDCNFRQIAPIPANSTRYTNVNTDINSTTYMLDASYNGQTITADVAAACPFDIYGNPRRAGDPVGACARTSPQ